MSKVFTNQKHQLLKEYMKKKSVLFLLNKKHEIIHSLYIEKPIVWQMGMNNHTCVLSLYIGYRLA